MWESANLRIQLTGKVIRTIGTQPQGQGHETTRAQIVSEELGIPVETGTAPWNDQISTSLDCGTHCSCFNLEYTNGNPMH